MWLHCILCAVEGLELGTQVPAGADLGVLKFCVAKAGARQVHILPVTSLHSGRAKSASPGALLGGDGGQAGIVPGHQEEAMGILGTASLPSSQAICSPGCKLAWGQSRAATMVGPACQRSQGPVCRSTVPWGVLCLLCWLCRCPDCAEILLYLSWGASGCCGRSMDPVPLCRAGCMEWAGLLTACLALGTGLTSSPGPWPAALTSQLPVIHVQPYLLAWSCLQGLITSGQSTHWCSAASSSHAAAERTGTRAAPALSKLGKENRSGG